MSAGQYLILQTMYVSENTIAGEPAAHYQHRQAHHNQAELPRLNRKGSTRVTEKRTDSAAEDKILQTFT